MRKSWSASWPGRTKNALQKHFLALGAEGRRLRFGISIGDAAVCAYVSHIDFERDAAFGVYDDDLQLTGAAHLARGNGTAELGVSVLHGHRGHGLGGALFMHCLSENRAMMHLARKQGMDIVAESGEADAWLKLPPADACSRFGEGFDQRIALFDHALKTLLANGRRIAGALAPATQSASPEK